jgi:anti-anti-sigma factor
MRGRLADLQFDGDGEVIVARLSGEIDDSNAGELRGAMIENVSNDARGLVLDLSAATYLDSSAVALLFELARGLAARRQSLRLAVPTSAPIRRVLELCDVGSVAPLDERTDDAVAAMATTLRGL